MQPDPKFLKASKYLTDSLLSGQGLPTGWLAPLRQVTELPVQAADVKPISQEFPGRSELTTTFAVDDLRTELQDLIQSGQDGVKLSVGEAGAVAQQLGLLLDLQRYGGRRKINRAVRILNAAHRRALLTHVRGPINQKLLATVEDTLAQAR